MITQYSRVQLTLSEKEKEYYILMLCSKIQMLNFLNSMK